MEKLNGVKAAISAFFTALGAFLGWQGVMIAVWVGLMLIDYITGTCAAVKKGEWSSATARDGLWHKGGMIVVVLVAGLTDVVMDIVVSHIPLDMTWPVVILPLVLAWYIITEVGSILENCVKLGAPIPSWLIKILKVGGELIDRTGEAVTGQLDAAPAPEEPSGEAPDPEEHPEEHTE